MKKLAMTLLGLLFLLTSCGDTGTPAQAPTGQINDPTLPGEEISINMATAMQGHLSIPKEGTFGGVTVIMYNGKGYDIDPASDPTILEKIENYPAATEIDVLFEGEFTNIVVNFPSPNTQTTAIKLTKIQEK